MRNLNTTRGKMKSGTTNNDWKVIENTGQLEEIQKESFQKPVVIFKNSTRCGISQSTLNHLKESMADIEVNNPEISFYLLDIVQFRNISSHIAQKFMVQHESPQLLLVENGKCTYHKNHWNISYTDLIRYLKEEKTSTN